MQDIRGKNPRCEKREARNKMKVTYIKKEEPREKSQEAKEKRQEVADKITKEARGQRQEAKDK